MDRHKISLLGSRFNAGMFSFDLNFSHTAREPDDVALFLDDIGNSDIDFGSVGCIYQLLKALKTKIDSYGLSADFLKAKKDVAAINLLEGEAAIYYSFQN